MKFNFASILPRNIFSLLSAHIAVCGDLFDFSFDLPFDDFLPRTLPLRFWIQVSISKTILFWKCRNYCYSGGMCREKVSTWPYTYLKCTLVEIFCCLWIKMQNYYRGMVPFYILDTKIIVVNGETFVNEGNFQLSLFFKANFVKFLSTFQFS